MVLILLPGMDGTGDLFAPFVEAFGPAQRVRIVRYPTSELLGYSELEAVARAALPSEEPYVLLAESFSGPIAIALAAARPAQLRGLILCCTFATNPHPAFAWLRGMIGILPMRPPMKVLEALLCGRFSKPTLRAALAAALQRVSPAVFRARLAAVLEVNVVSELQAVHLPVLYLRATEDRVVPARSSRFVIAHCPHAKMVELVAPHFLLQAVPDQAATAVAKFMHELGDQA